MCSNGDGRAAAPDDQALGRVQKLGPEFRLCEEAHARAGRATAIAAMRCFYSGAEQAWRLAALAVDQAISPTVAGAPPRQFAAAIEKMLAVFDDAERAAADLVLASLPTMTQQMEREDEGE